MKSIAVLALLCTVSCLAAEPAAWKQHAGKPGPSGWRCNIIQPDPEDHGPDGVNIHDWDDDGDLDLFVNYEEGKYSRLYFNPGKTDVRKIWSEYVEFKHGKCEDSGMGDLDGDGDLDYIANGGWIYFNPGTWEGGFRVPFAARWPAGFPQGVTYDQPISSLDIFATITALAEAPIAPERPLDGVNLTPFLRGERKDAPHEGIFLRKFDQGIRAVRSGDYKLVEFEKTGIRSLHNLKHDISEATNIAGDNPDVRKRLSVLWEDWNKPNVEPTFAGLMMRKGASRKQDSVKKQTSTSPASDRSKKDAEY
jgi:arylsulfatase A-like enzyme